MFSYFEISVSFGKNLKEEEGRRRAGTCVQTDSIMLTQQYKFCGLHSFNDCYLCKLEAGDKCWWETINMSKRLYSFQMKSRKPLKKLNLICKLLTIHIIVYDHIEAEVRYGCDKNFWMVSVFTFMSILILFWHLNCIFTIASPCLSEQEAIHFLLKFRKIPLYVMPQTASLILKKRTVWADDFT